MANKRKLRPMSFPEESNGPVILEYIMVDLTKHNIITRTWIENSEPQWPQDCPIRHVNHYDNCAMEGDCIDVAMHPVFICKDPFRQGRHKIVLCEPHYVDKPNKRIEYNTRTLCKAFMEKQKVKEEEPLYAFEQEYYVVDDKGVPLDMYADKKGREFYDFEMSIGDHISMERDLSETHMRACLYAGLKISGLNRECHPSEWEYQVGPLPAVDVCDHVIVSRYILLRLAEMNDINITFINPECTRDTDMRSALHLNFSTRGMRGELGEGTGLGHIHSVAENIGKHSQEYVFKYYGSSRGLDIRWFLSGQCYMPTDKFKVDTCKELSSIRIPYQVECAGKGYIEERRVMSDADPYEVCVALTECALFDTVGYLDDQSKNDK